MRGPIRVLRDVFFRGDDRDQMRDAVHSGKLTAALFEISRAMAFSPGDVTASMRQIANAVPMILNVSRAIIFLFDESGKHVSPFVGAGMVYMGLFRRVKISAGARGFKEILEADEPFVMETSTMIDDRVKAVVERLHISEFLVAPITMDDGKAGFITADSPVDGRSFSSDDLKIMSVMANFAGVTLKNSMMFRKLEGKARKLEAIFDVSRALDRAEDLDSLLRLIVDKAVELMGATSGSIILIDRETDTLVIKAANGLPDEVEEGVRLKVGEGITGWVAREGMAVFVPDVLEDPRYVMVHEEIRSEMAVPLKWGLETIGILNLDHVRVGAFKKEDLDLLEIFGHKASVALRQAFLLERVKSRDKN